MMLQRIGGGRVIDHGPMSAVSRRRNRGGWSQQSVGALQLRDALPRFLVIAATQPPIGSPEACPLGHHRRMRLESDGWHCYECDELQTKCPRGHRSTWRRVPHPRGDATLVCAQCRRDDARARKERERRQRGVPVRQTSGPCRYGHPESERFLDSRGYRACRSCMREATRRHRSRL